MTSTASAARIHARLSAFAAIVSVALLVAGTPLVALIAGSEIAIFAACVFAAMAAIAVPFAIKDARGGI